MPKRPVSEYTNLGSTYTGTPMMMVPGSYVRFRHTTQPGTVSYSFRVPISGIVDRKYIGISVLTQEGESIGVAGENGSASVTWGGSVSTRFTRTDGQGKGQYVTVLPTTTYIQLNVFINGGAPSGWVSIIAGDYMDPEVTSWSSGTYSFTNNPGTATHENNIKFFDGNNGAGGSYTVTGPEATAKADANADFWDAVGLTMNHRPPHDSPDTNAYWSIGGEMDMDGFPHATAHSGWSLISAVGPTWDLDGGFAFQTVSLGLVYRDPAHDHGFDPIVSGSPPSTMYSVEYQDGSPYAGAEAGTTESCTVYLDSHSPTGYALDTDVLASADFTVDAGAPNTLATWDPASGIGPTLDSVPKTAPGTTSTINFTSHLNGVDLGGGYRDYGLLVLTCSADPVDDQIGNTWSWQGEGLLSVWNDSEHPGTHVDWVIRSKTYRFKYRPDLIWDDLGPLALDVVRQWPRDDGRGLSVGPRIFPVPKGITRIFGGFD